MQATELGLRATGQHDTMATGAGRGAADVWQAALTSTTNLLNAIGSFWIFGLMCMMLADLGSRLLFNKPISGVAEIAGLSIVAIVYLQLAAAVRSGRMTRADFLADLLAAKAPRLALVLGVLFQLIGAATMAGLAYISLAPFVAAWTDRETFGTAGVFLVVTWPFRGMLLLGTVLAALCYMTLAVTEAVRLVNFRRGA